MSTFDAASGVVHYDVHDPADLAHLIETGLIWRGGPKTQRLAIDALLRGDVARPDNLPEHIRAYLDRSQQPASVDQPGGANEIDSATAADPGGSDQASNGVPVATDPSAWACPEHGTEDVVILTSRQGRVYGACNLCDEFDDGLTPEQREREQAEAERQRAERRRRQEREQAERRAQLLADRRARTCAHCGRIERLHSGETHVFAGGALAHATSGLIQAALVVGVIVALWLFWVSATTPDAPFHSLTGPLLCFWDWKGTACP
jgi:hypothetical protein